MTKEDKDMELVDKAIAEAIKLTDDTDQQYWYQEGYRDGADMKKQDLIGKACEWIESEVADGDIIEGCRDISKLLDNFRKAMEE